VISLWVAWIITDLGLLWFLGGLVVCYRFGVVMFSWWVGGFVVLLCSLGGLVMGW
jgi:hypothetical protein